MSLKGDWQLNLQFQLEIKYGTQSLSNRFAYLNLTKVVRMERKEVNIVGLCESRYAV